MNDLEIKGLIESQLRLRFKSIRIGAPFSILNHIDYAGRLWREDESNINRYEDSRGKLIAGIDKNENVVYVEIVNVKDKNIFVAIQKFLNVEYLIINNCDVEELNLDSFQKLKLLDLDTNKIMSLPNGLFSLTGLEHLIVANNDINNIPNNIADLGELSTFDIRNNNLVEVPMEILKLEKAWKVGEKIGKIRSDIHSSVRSQNYELAADQRDLLFKVAPQIGGGILLGGNEISYPPIEIWNRGRTAIKNYVDSLDSSEKIPINEIKIIVVGEGGAGKTSLVKRLIGNEFNSREPQTQGINIWSNKVDSNDSIVYRSGSDLGQSYYISV